MSRFLTLPLSLVFFVALVGCSSANKAVESSDENKPEWFTISASTDLGAVGNYSTGNGYMGNYSMSVRVRAQKLPDSEAYKVLQVQVKNGMGWARVYFRAVVESSEVYKFDFGGQTYYFKVEG